MKIIISSLTYPLKNGVTNSINLSVDYLKKRGHEIRIVAPEYDEGRVRDEHLTVPSSTIGKIFLNFFGKKERMFSATASIQIAQIFKSFKPDVSWFHTVTWFPSAFERVMSKSKTGKVLTYHTMVEDYGRVYAGNLGANHMISRSKNICNSFDQIITPSQVMKDKLLSYSVTKPIDVIPTGITPAKEYLSKQDVCQKFQIDPSKKILLFTGRVSKEKNISALFEMMTKLANYDQYVLLMVGPGDLGSLKAEVAKIGLAKSIVFTGGVSAEEAKSIYGGVDAFVFASQTETQGLVIQEAMIAKTPVVALYSPIQPEIYPDNTALICRSAEEMASKLDRFLDDQSLVKKNIEAAFKFVQDNFSPEVMAEKQEKVLFLAQKSN